MRAWKTILATVVAMDIKSAETIHALQLLEAVEGHLAGSGDELKELSTLFLIK